MKVHSILTTKRSKVITIKPDASLVEVSKLLSEHNIGAVVVVDDNESPQGIISERDIVRCIAQNGPSGLSQAVDSVMTKDIIIALPDDELDHLSNIMTEKRIRHLPVISGQELIGIVSIGDILKAQMHHYEGEALTLRQYVTGGGLG